MINHKPATTLGEDIQIISYLKFQDKYIPIGKEDFLCFHLKSKDGQTTTKSSFDQVIEIKSFVKRCSLFSDCTRPWSLHRQRQERDDLRKLPNVVVAVQVADADDAERGMKLRVLLDPVFDLCVKQVLQNKVAGTKSSRCKLTRSYAQELDLESNETAYHKDRVINDTSKLEIIGAIRCSIRGEDRMIFLLKIKVLQNGIYGMLLLPTLQLI